MPSKFKQKLKNPRAIPPPLIMAGQVCQEPPLPILGITIGNELPTEPFADQPNQPVQWRNRGIKVGVKNDENRILIPQINGMILKESAPESSVIRLNMIWRQTGYESINEEIEIQANQIDFLISK